MHFRLPWSCHFICTVLNGSDISYLIVSPMKKKIFLNGRFLTQSITGVQRTAHELIKALDNLIDESFIDPDQYELILIAPKEDLQQLHLKHIRLIQKGFLKGNLWEQLELPIYTFNHLLVSMGYVSSLLKRKQIIVMHDAATFSHPLFFKLAFRTWYKFAISILNKIALHIITVSKYSKSELIKYTKIKGDKVSVIYNAPGHIELYKEPEDEFKEKIKKLQPFFLGVSSLHPHKNFEMLSEAIVKADLSGYKMLIAGGAHAKSFEKVTLHNSIVVLGYVTNEQLKYLYSNASLFIFPSLFEGFGIPPLEAMMLGCPVLSSTATALPEVLGDACEYFDPHNVNDLVAKIEALVKNKTRLDELRDSGYERAALYNWKTSAVSLFELIKKFAP